MEEAERSFASRMMVEEQEQESPVAVVDDNENRVAVAQPSEKSPVRERSFASPVMELDQDAAADECGGPSKRARIDPIAIMELQYLDHYETNDQDHQYKRTVNPYAPKGLRGRFIRGPSEHTCFLNAALQGLFHCQEIADWIDRQVEQSFTSKSSRR